MTTRDEKDRGSNDGDGCDGEPSCDRTSGHDEVNSSGDDCEGCPRSGGDVEMPSIFADTRAKAERRDYAKILATVGGLTAIGSLAAPVASLTRVFVQEYTGPVYSAGVHLVDDQGNRVSVDDLDYGEGMTVFPEPRPGIEQAPTILVRYKEYSGATKKKFVAEGGYAAYSKICTHAGCMVGEEDQDPLVCPCHFGKFDPTRGAVVVGGPPPRPLPQLPLSVTKDGFLVATGDFEAPVGPGGGE